MFIFNKKIENYQIQKQHNPGFQRARTYQGSDRCFLPHNRANFKLSEYRNQAETFRIHQPPTLQIIKQFGTS